jgi:HAD superfamily hydrolase (TIGR01459 family)
MQSPHPSSRQAPPAPRQLSGLSEIAPDFDVLLCDVWGVIHNGVAHFPKAIDALQHFRAQGGTVIFITNAPRSGAKVISFLDKLSVPHDAYDAVVSSGDVTVSLIAERGTKRPMHLGPDYDSPLFDAAAKLLGHMPHFAPLDTADYVVCTGLLDDRTETPADYAGQLAQMRRRNLDFICANPDIVVQVGDGLIYCAGALAEAYEALGGHVIQAGKPHAPIYARALEEAARLRGKIPASARVLAIGDAMHTDIKGAQRQSLATLFVTSGIHRAELHTAEAPSELDAAAFRQFFENTGFAPMAATTELAW